jgi:N-acetylneuraminic acid mutarotase
MAGRYRRLSLAIAALSALVTACTHSPQHSASSIRSAVRASQSAAPSAQSAAPTPTSAVTPAKSACQETLGAAAPTPTISATTIAARLPIALSRLIAVRAGDRVLVIGGLDAHDRTTAAIEAFDPNTGAIKPAGQLPAAVHDAGAGVLGGRAIVGGGGSSASIDDVQTVAANGSASIIGHLPKPRSDDSMAVDGNTAYVVGGYDGRVELPDVLATTDGSTFRRAGLLAETVRYAAAYASSGALWVFGGEHHGSVVADIQRVDLTTGAARVVAKLPHPLAHESAAAVGNVVYLVGGSYGGKAQSTIYAFDPARGTVTLVGALPKPVSDAATVTVGDTTYVIGGETLAAQGFSAPTDTVVMIRVAAPHPAKSCN